MFSKTNARLTPGWSNNRSCPSSQSTAMICSLEPFLCPVVQPLSHVRPSETPRTAARQASLSFTVSQSSLKLTSIESVMPSNHLILCHPLLLPPPDFPSIRVFCNRTWLSLYKMEMMVARLKPGPGGFLHLPSCKCFNQVLN